MAAVVMPACRRAPTAAPARTITLSIVGTNDLHGAIAPRNGQGGLALLAGYVSNLRAARAADGGSVLLLDGGDLFQGTLESNLNEGAAVIQAYNALGYAASAVGNHEFDYGPQGAAATPKGPADDPRGALKARIGEASFPFLSANLIDAATQQPLSFPNLHPSALLTVDGIRVGVVGLATAATLTATMPANTAGIEVTALAPAVVREATGLRSRGATVVVVVAHAGGKCSAFDRPDDLSSCDANAEIFRLAHALPAHLVDAIVAGHVHEGIAHNVNGIAIESAFSRGTAFGRIDLTIDAATKQVVGQHIFPPHALCATVNAAGRCAAPDEAGAVTATYEGREVAPSASIAAILQPAVATADAVRSTPLGGVAGDFFVFEDSKESALGNLVADWVRMTVRGADVGLANGGGLRANLPAGPITYGRLYEIMPFDNLEAFVTITGAQLKAMIANNLSRRGSFMLLSGVRATARCEAGALTIDLMKEPDATVHDNDRLKLATMDFLAAGGDGFFNGFLPLPSLLPATPAPPVVREAIAAWMKTHPREWRSAQLFDAAHPRVRYPGVRPVRCD